MILLRNILLARALTPGPGRGLNARNSRVFTLLLAILVCTSMGSAHAAGAALKMHAKIAQSTCTVNVGSNDGDGVLNFGDLPTDVIPANWEPLAKVYKEFRVNLTNCGLIGTAGLTPALTLSGGTLQDSPDSQVWAFRDSGTAQGFGFGIYNDGTTFNQSKIVAVETATGKEAYWYIAIPGVTNGTVTAGSAEVPLRAIVTCANNCTNTKPKTAGSLSATVTFNLRYK